MIFGAVSDDLLPGAHNAINTCLAIRRSERVALVADEASRAVAASLEQALVDAGADARCLLIESVASRCGGAGGESRSAERHRLTNLPRPWSLDPVIAPV